MKARQKVLLVGGSEGIGKKLVSLYLKNDDYVFTTYTKLKPKNFTSKNISLFRLDLSSQRNLTKFIKQINRVNPQH